MTKMNFREGQQRLSWINLCLKKYNTMGEIYRKLQVNLWNQFLSDNRWKFAHHAPSFMYLFCHPYIFILNPKFWILINNCIANPKSGAMSITNYLSPLVVHKLSTMSGMCITRRTKVFYQFVFNNRRFSFNF